MIHLIGATVSVPYPSWLNPADNTWQITAATFVGLMSLPGLAVLYASIVPKKWAVNVMAMMFAGFSLVLIAWVLWSYKLGFGSTSIGGGVHNGLWTQQPLTGVNKTGTWQHFFDNLWGKPGGITSSVGEQSQAVSAANTAIPFHFPTSTLAYFQFVFAAITPLLFMGSVLGRIKFSAWCLLVPLWSTFVYSIDAFLLWGGGYFAQEGALDFSGGYVIHMSAGVSGFVAAWVLGPRLLRDRQHALPNNLVMAGVGAGILWLGWNGFNGGDPYYAGSSMAGAVINTNLATAVGVVVWMALDALLTKERKPTFLGGVNGMICGLVGITPCAGWVDGWGAIMVGVFCTIIVWVAWNYLSKVRPFSKVDDALGVIYTHGIAGLCGGLLVGVFADPKMIEYLGIGGTANASYSGAFYGHPGLVWTQLLAGLTIIVWDGVVTFVLLKLIGLFIPLRYSDEVLEIGDVAIHDEQVEPPQDAHRVFEGAGFTPAGRALAGAAAPTGGGPASEVTP